MFGDCEANVFFYSKVQKCNFQSKFENNNSKMETQINIVRDRSDALKVIATSIVQEMLAMVVFFMT